jgi:hypothetical protein
MGSPEPFSNDVAARVRASISNDEVLQQLDQICRSSTFESQGNSKKLLRYLVGESLEGRPIKPESIAKEVLGKLNFGAGDSHVRKEMEKLRTRLGEYYDAEAGRDEIWLHIPQRQYTVFWRHSGKTLLGQTEWSEWVQRAAKLSPDDAKRASETAHRFWPHLASTFPVFCDESFSAQIHNGKIELPETVQLFFNSISNYHIYLTTQDCSEIRVYPLNVWLAEWARLKSSDDDDHKDLSVYEFWGKGLELENRTTVTIHKKLLKALNLPLETDSRGITMYFSPEGFLCFFLPEPVPRPTGKCNLYALSYKSKSDEETYYYVLVHEDQESPFQEALHGTQPFNIKSYAYVVASGRGQLPPDLKDRMLAKYDAVLAGSKKA